MVDLKLLEDLLALEQTGSFVRAAERRHVTHPAFGRRIKALESWAGAPLVERQHIPVRLTLQGETLLRTASQMLEQMEQVRHRLRSTGPAADPVLRVATGRSLARTLVADWIVRLRRKPRPVLGTNCQVDLTTGRVQDLAALLESGKTDLLCAYAHSAITELLSPARYRYLTLAADKLVPVSQVDRRGLAAVVHGGGRLPPRCAGRPGWSRRRDCLRGAPVSQPPATVRGGRVGLDDDGVRPLSGAR